MQTAEFPSQLNIKATSQASNAKLADFKGFALKQNSNLIRDEVQKLTQFNVKIQDIVSKIQKNKTQCEQTIKSLRNQISQLDSKITNYQKKQMSSNAQEQYKGNIRGLQADLLNTCKERVQIANSINIKTLAKIDIQDKKSTANDIFKWVLIAFYNEPDNKFFWPNFKEEALENDKGRDFLERLGKVSSMNINEGQRIKTKQFLQKYKEYVSAPQLEVRKMQLQGSRQQMEKIHKIAILFQKGDTISSEIKNNEKLIQKHKQSTMQRDQQFMRWKARSEALKDRITINERYLRVLGETEQKLQPKISSYGEVCRNGQKLKGDFENYDKWSPTISLGQQNKSNCECKIF